MDPTVISTFMGTASGMVATASLLWLMDRRRRRKRNARTWEGMIARSSSSPSGRTVALDESERRLVREARMRFERQQKRANAIGPRIRLIGALLPVGDEWRIEEMVNHRNELRDEYGHVPRFHYVRLFLSVLEIRWEARVYPERRVD